MYASCSVYFMYVCLLNWDFVARRLAERRKSEEYEESDAEVVRQTAVEAEDVWDAELQTFHPASRSTGQSGDLAPSKHKELISFGL